jgi:2-phosphosulfolactate phosphatase
MVSLFDAGANSVYVSASRSDFDKARAAVGPLGIICAEQDDGSSPEGFDYEPSPSVLSRLELRDRAAMLATANGTPAILAANQQGASLILAGALRNLRAVTQRAYDEAKARGADITVICSGQLRNSRIAIEDSYCAGLMVERLHQLSGGAVDLDDSAALARGYAASAPDALDVLIGSMTSQRFIAQGRRLDVEFCAIIDASDRVPVVGEDGVGDQYPVYVLDD